MRVAIAGAHGKVAMRLARRLVARGDSVIGLVRNPEHAAEVGDTGAEPVVCDLEAQLGAHARELGRLWPELASSPPRAHGDPEWGQAALLDAVRALLEAAARGRRVLLVLDDLHWAAGGTLLLLRHLLGPSRPARVLVVASYRERELPAGGALHRLVAHLLSSDDGIRLSLEGIDEAAVAELVAEASGEANATRHHELAHILRTQTSGNPFFVRELVARLAASGGLASQAPLRQGHIEVPERRARSSWSGWVACRSCAGRA